MLADLLVLETAMSAFAGTCILMLSSRMGAPLWVGAGLLILAFLTLCFLVSNIIISRSAANRRLDMWELAQKRGLITTSEVSDDLK